MINIQSYFITRKRELTPLDMTIAMSSAASLLFQMPPIPESCQNLPEPCYRDTILFKSESISAGRNFYESHRTAC